MFGSWFGRRKKGRKSRANVRNSESSSANQEGKQIKKLRRVPRNKRPKRTSVVPEIGDFVNGVDQYGNMEKPSPGSFPKFKKSLLEDLIMQDPDTLKTMLAFLTPSETARTSMTSKIMKIGMRECPLYWKPGSAPIPLSYVEDIVKPVKFSDGVTAPQWYIKGIVSGVSEIKTLLNLIDCDRVEFLAFTNKEMKDLSKITVCKNLKQLDLVHSLNLKDMSPLESLPLLKSMTLINLDKLVEMKSFVKVELLADLRVFQCENIENMDPIGKCVNLKRFGITKNSKVKDFTFLHTLLKLETLDLSHMEHLTTMEFFPKTRTMKQLFLINCAKLEDISWLRDYGDNLEMIKMDKCEAVKDISHLENCLNLEHFSISDNSLIGSMEKLDGFIKMSRLFIEDCPNITGLVPMLSSMYNLEVLVLKGSKKLTAAEAQELKKCTRLLLLECSNCPAEFLGKLMLAENIVLRRAAKESVETYLTSPNCSNEQLEEAKTLVTTILPVEALTNVTFLTAPATHKALSVIVELCSKVRNIAIGLLGSTLFTKMVEILSDYESKSRPKTNGLMLSVIEASFSSEPLSIRLFLDEREKILMYIHYMTITDIKRTAKPGTPNAAAEDEVFVHTIGTGMSIIAIILSNIRESLFIDPKHNPPHQTRAKIDPLKLLELIPDFMVIFEKHGVIKKLLNAIKKDAGVKDHQNAAYKVLNELTSLIDISNQIRTSRLGFTNTINDDFQLDELKIPESILNEGISSVLEAIPEMEFQVKITASSWLLQLVEKGGDEAIASLIRKRESVIQILKDVFMISLSMLFSRIKDKINFALEAVTKLIETGAKLLKYVPGNMLMNLLDKTSAEELTKLLLHLIEFHNELISDCIREENSAPPPFFQYSESSVKKHYVKNVNIMLGLLQTLSEQKECCDIMVVASEKYPGIVASLLHLSTDQLDLYDSTIDLMMYLSNNYEAFKKKLQYLYTNSEITVALKLFLDPTPGFRPRHPKSLSHKKKGLRLMLLLLESQNFRTKFLDYSGNEHKNFVAQFKRYVYEVKAEEGRSDVESLKLCGEIVGRLISAENNTPEKVNGVVTKYVFPLLEDFKTLSTNEKFKELKQREDEAIELDEKNAKPRPDREPQAVQNPFQALLNGLLGGARPPEPDLDEDIVGNLAQTLFKVPEPEPAEPPPANNAPPVPPNFFQTLFGMAPPDPIAVPPTINQAPAVVVDRSLFQLNWAFRICVYLSTVFDTETAFTTLSIMDIDFLQATIGELQRSLTNRNEEEYTRRAKLVEAATTQLLSTVLTSLLNSNGRALAEIKIEAEEADPADESAAQFETMAQNAPAQNPIFNLLNMLGPNQHGRAREQLEEQRRQQGIRIRLLLNKQRQLEYVRKLSQRILEGTETTQTKEVSVVEAKLNAKAVEIIDLVWDNLAGADDHRTTIQNCLTLVETGDHEFGVQAAFSLLTALFRVSAKKDGTHITNFLDGNKRFMDSMERKFTILAEREDALYNFLLLAVEANPTIAFQVLTLVIDLFRSYSPETNEEDVKKRFFASRLVLTAMSSQEASKNSIIELVKKDWTLPVQMAVYLINSMKDQNELKASQNVFLALSLILGNDSANIMKIMEHEEVASFPTFLVNTLRNASTTTSEACLRMLNGMFDPTALNSASDAETLRKFALVLIDGGIVDILSCWRKEDGTKKPIELLTPWEKTSGLIVVEIIAVSGSTDLLKEKENALVIPNLLEFLIQSPSSQLAGTLLRLEPDFSAEASGVAVKQLSKFPVFAEALAREASVAERQISDGDIVMRRIRGLPFQVSAERKYSLDFKETISTVAVKPVKGLKGTAEEGDSIYFEAVVSSNSYGNSSGTEEKNVFGKVGLISSNFKEGLFEGQLSKGVGDDKFSCGVVVNGSDVIGVKVNMTKGSIVFKRNGKTVLKEKSDDIITEIEENGFFPAISGKNLSCVINLGQMPFKFAPNNNKWISYKNFVGA